MSTNWDPPHIRVAPDREASELQATPAHIQAWDLFSEFCQLPVHLLVPLPFPPADAALRPYRATPARHAASTEPTSQDVLRVPRENREAALVAALGLVD